MARVAVTVEDLEAGTLPGVCAKTGEQADGFATIEFTSTPQWTWILLLFGILPFVIARAFSKVRVVGLVPMSDMTASICAEIISGDNSTTPVTPSVFCAVMAVIADVP